MAQSVVPKIEKPVPKFVIEDGGPYERTVAKYIKEKRLFEFSKIEEPSSYILKFPRGHSIRVRTRAEVERLVGDPENIDIVDFETSDVVGRVNKPLPKKGE